MSDSHDVLAEKLQRAIETGELMDALILAQDLLAETRRLGNPADGEVAVLLSLTGNLLAQRGFVTNALVTLEEADAEWARCPDERLKLFWQARNSQFRGLALQTLGRHQEAVTASELALAMYRAVLLDVDDAAGVEPDEALELITLAVELGGRDAESAAMLDTITFFIAKCSKDIAHAHLALVEVGVALPWLDVVYRAIDRVGDAQRPLFQLEATDGYRVLMATVMTLYSPDEDLPPAVEAAMDRLDFLTDEHVDLSQLPAL
jgi:tetratricopeptide (TPR) repeat protein